jgi:hypothetical protein
MFIADPALAKLVHFQVGRRFLVLPHLHFGFLQGYASELLPVMVAGIPSMHICLDFISELLSQPHTEKRVSCILFYPYKLSIFLFLILCCNAFLIHIPFPICALYASGSNTCKLFKLTLASVPTTADSM